MRSVKYPDGYLIPPFCQEKTGSIELLDEAEFNCQVSNNLQLLRAYRALTQSQLADFLQCERSSYSYCEAGKTGLSAYRLYLLSQFYGVHPEALWGTMKREQGMLLFYPESVRIL